MGWIDIGEKHRPDRDTDRAADDEWRHIPPSQRVPQLPDAIALRPEAVTDDQRSRLDRCDDVQPYAGYDKAHGKTGQTGCKTTHERCQQKKSKNNAIHCSLPPGTRPAPQSRSFVACADAERALQRRIVSNAVRPQLLEVATGGQAIENAEQ